MSKARVLAALRESGGTYVVLSGRGHSKDIGYLSSAKKLYSKIASFAVKNDLKSVTVSTGRNIMNVDGPSASFSVSVSIS